VADGFDKPGSESPEVKLESEGHARFHLAAIIESADDAIISKNLRGIVSSWNGAAYRIFGYTAEEMIGRPILRLIPEALHYEEEEILRKLRAGERIDHYETTRLRKNGELIEVSVTISPIRDAAGHVIGASKIVRDISDRKRMEQVLMQAEKLAVTGRMAAAIAHEINNPLESLMNLIFLARQNSPVEGKAHRYLLTAESELERVAHIARQTLGYYRDAGKPAAVQLHDLIETVLAVYQTKLLSGAIFVDRRFDDLQEIVVSKGEMIQVFSNIIANAVDAMAEGGALHISTHKATSPAGDGIETIIRDEGAGIEREHLDKIYQAFFTTKGDRGTGIGLWVVKELVEKRGGHVAITSNTEKGNSGTSVMIFLPFAIPQIRLSEERGTKISL
jgi:PAS domain S-box-containing protein